MKRARESDADGEGDTRGGPAASATAAAAPSTFQAATAHTSFVSPSAVLAIDTAGYDSQLAAKLVKLKDLFAGLSMPEVEVHTSEPQHYRMRAEFNVRGTRREDVRPHYIMFATGSAGEQPGASDQQAEESGGDVSSTNGNTAATTDASAVASTSAPAPATTAAATGDKAAGGKAGKGKGRRGQPKKPAAERVEIQSFPVGSRLMNELMPLVLDACSKNAVLKDSLFQVNYHTTLSGEAVVVLLYHKKLDETWKEAARALRPVLAAGAPSANGQLPHIIGRSRKQKVCLDQDFVVEKLTVHGRQYLYRQYEGSFSQPNGGVCQKMLEWAVDVTRGSTDHDLLELYCGNGNFTIPLSQNFRRVVATEVSKVGVEAAKWNITANSVSDKVFVGRLSSEEFVETWRAKGTRRRLEGLGDWSELSLRTLFVDPPRAGLDAETVKLMAEFDRVVYISCNPETLHANLQGVAGVTHDVVRFAAFDQFPFTHHLECGVYLVKKASSTA